MNRFYVKGHLSIRHKISNSVPEYLILRPCFDILGTQIDGKATMTPNFSFEDVF